MQKVDVPASSDATATASAALTPGVNAGRDTHPGPETGYVLDGELTLWVDGNPLQMLKPGDFRAIAMVAVRARRTPSSLPDDG